MITFTRVTQTFDETTGLSTSVTSTITGSAIKVKGKADTYTRIGLVESSAPTLLFTPTDYDLHAHSDEFVKAGDTVSWAGATFTAKDVDPIAPDGFVILARIVVAK
jgi:hypothetical protein